MRKVIIMGAGGHAKVLIDILERVKTLEIAGLIDVSARLGGRVLNYDVIGTDDDLVRLKSEGVFETILIGVGDPARRKNIHERILKTLPDAVFETAIHPQATVGADVEIAPGTVIMAGAVINPSCRIGTHCVINTCASMDHDGVLEDFVGLAPNAATGGNVHIGCASHVGMGASIIQNVRIGANCLIGAGSVVLDDIPEGSKVMGIPARANP